MKNLHKLLLLAFISNFIIGCSTISVQHVTKPDINQPLNENETIIQLKRADYFMASLNNATVVANDKSIGELANADELVWKTNSNSLECIVLQHGESYLTTGQIKLNDTPVSYKCFETKPKTIMTLNYDIFYPESRVVRELAFLPIYKQSPTYDKDTKIVVNVINSTSPDAQSEQDLKAKLETAVKNQFGDNITTSSSKAIELEILEYKTGNAAARWVVQSMAGSTYIKVKIVIKEGDHVIDTFITRLVVRGGGLYSIGADDYIFDEAAEDISLYLFGNKR